MRVFAAIELPADARVQIGVWQRRAIRGDSGLRPVRPDCCHLTLRFLGGVGESSVDAMARMLETWTPGPLPFSLHSVGSFGGNGRPVVCWLGGTFPEAVIRLALRLGTVPDDRGRVHEGTFIPHITVARSRGPETGTVPADPAPIRGFLTTAAIYDSRLTPSGPEYRTMRRFDISGTNPAADGGRSDGR